MSQNILLLISFQSLISVKSTLRSPSIQNQAGSGPWAVECPVIQSIAPGAILCLEVSSCMILNRIEEGKDISVSQLIEITTFNFFFFGCARSSLQLRALHYCTQSFSSSLSRAGATL